MNSNRRSFLRLGSLAVGASCLLRPQSLFAIGSAKSSGGLSFDAAELRLLDFAAGYGTSARLTGISVLSRLRGGNGGMRLLVEVNDFIGLANTLPRAPFKEFHTSGNTLSFLSQGRSGLIENLSVEDFAVRLAWLSKQENIVFAHDALLYDPATKALTDPFGAVDAGELKLVTRPSATAAALGVALRGMSEARAAGMPEGTDFAQWKAQLVKSTVASKAAQPIVAVFVKKLPALAALGGTESVKSAMATPLVSSAFESALKLKSRTVIAEFDRVRGIFGQSYSDGAVWLYVLLGKQMKTDTRGWITADLLDDAVWRAAFADAGRIDQAFQSPELKSQA